MQKTNVKTIGDMAVRALQLEAATTPKPGLVDRENNGAHQDMDFALFIRSSESLRECFIQCAEAGADAGALRDIGLRGEAVMFETTNHVNTHKGLIFSMGILCGALGELARKGDNFEEKDVQVLCAGLAAELLHEDLAKNTHGLKVLGETGIKGIRGEALSGYKSVFGMSLMRLREAISEDYTFEQAMVKTLLHLMVYTEDSNLVHRGGQAGLTFVQEHACKILACADLRDDKDMVLVRDFDYQCIEKNLSPGGSADLLALTAMLYLFFEEIRKEE